MREIKFRAWIPKHKIMGTFEELKLCFKEELYWIDQNGKLFQNEALKEGKVMQFTGLKDKNGKEIYEGDIVKHNNNKNYEVKFGTFIEHVNDNEYTNDSYGWYIGDDEEFEDFEQIHNSNKVEIIGNIYENPELLESEK